MAKKKKTTRSKRAQQSSAAPAAPWRRWFVEHPNWAAFAIFAGLVAIFFHEALFGGKIYFVPDAQAPAALSLKLQEALRQHGLLAQWSPYIFAGMPSFASLTYTPFSYFPYIALMPIASFMSLPTLFPQILHYPFAGLGVYLILRDREADFLPAVFGGIAFMFTPHLIAMETFGHGSKLMTAAYMPLAFWAVRRALCNHVSENGGLLHFGLAALILGLQFQRSHVQIVYYTWMLLGAYFVYFALRQLAAKNGRAVLPNLGKFVLLFALGLGLAAMLYLPIYEYTAYSIRGAASALAGPAAGAGVGFEYATQWSFSFGEMLTFLIPSFYGFGGQTYWGTMPFTDYPHYMGILVFLLGIFALIYRRRHFDLFLGVVIVLTLLISFGKNFPPMYKFFYSFFPYFNKFRVPVMILIVAQMAFALLAGIGLQRLLDFLKLRIQLPNKSGHKLRDPGRLANRILVVAIGLILLAVIISIAESTVFNAMRDLYPDRYPPAMQSQIDRQRFDMLFTDFWIVVLIVATGLVMLSMAMKQLLQPRTFILVICALTLVDIWLVSGKINKPVSKTNMESYLQEDELFRALQADSSVYRIFPLNIPFIGLNLFRENRWAAHGIQSIGGYNAAKPRVYQDLLDISNIANNYIQKYYFVGQRNGQSSLERVADHLIDPVERQAHQHLLDLLNVKYIISPFPIPEPALQKRYEVRHAVGNRQVPLSVFENTSVLPRAFLAGRYRVFESPKLALNYMISAEFDPSQQVVLYKTPALPPRPDSTAQAELVAYGMHEIRVKTQAVQPQLLVLSDTYYPPGWHARIDGKPAEILQADHAFRAVSLPAGKHEVVFYYASRLFGMGVWLSLLSALVVAGCLIVPTFRDKQEQPRRGGAEPA